MIYTVTSTLPILHGGRTKSLLNRIELLRSKLGIKQTILTTNYNSNYPKVYEDFIKRNILHPSTKIINIYDWLSGYNLYKKPLFHNEDNKINKIIEKNYNEKVDVKKNIIRYYNSLNEYKFCKIFDSEMSKVKFIDYFVKGTKHKVKRYEYNNLGLLHRETIYSQDNNRKIFEKYYDYKGRKYCEKFYSDSKTNNNYLIKIYNKNNEEVLFGNEKELFKYFFSSVFNDNDIVFNDARLLDLPLLENTKKTKNILVFHSTQYIEGTDNVKSSFKYALSHPEKVSKYLVLTDHQKEDIKAEYNIDEDKFIIIPHFMVPTKNKYKPKNQFVFMGRFDHVKQIPHILEAYKIYLEKGYKNKLLLFGSEYGDQLDVVKNKINDLNIKDKVEIYGFTDKPLDVFRESKASLMTSKFEGFPLSVMESINEGCPVISYDIRYGPNEIIKAGVSGYLVEPNNISDFAEKLILIDEKPLENVKLDYRITEQAAIKNYEKLFQILSMESR